jgi:predicted RNase H-like nuclease (RuvC/YqgF family)
MKKILLLITILFTLKSQISAQDFPKLYVVKGDTVGVIFSIQQAQKVDNDYELLRLLKQAKVMSDRTDSVYIMIVDNFGKQVVEYKLKVSTLESLVSTQNEQIKNLKDQIEKYQRDSFLANEQSLRKDTIINNNKKEIRKLKTQKFLGFTFSGGLIGIIILLLVK